MFNRIRMVFDAMINALMGKVEDPNSMLDQTYDDLQSNLIAVRQEVAIALATRTQLVNTLEQMENKNADTPAITEQKEKVAANSAQIEKLRRRLEQLENEVQKAYTKKQVLWARNNAFQPGLGDPELYNSALKYLLVVFLSMGFLQVALAYLR